MMHRKGPGPSTSERAPETSGRTIRYWARFYDAVTNLLLLGKEPAIRKMTIELAGVEPGEKVLDVGCGTGRLTMAAKAAAGAAGEVHGIDAAPEMIEVARRKAAEAGAEIGFQVGLAEDIPFPDDEFDVGLSSFVLHHLPEDLKRRGFAEMHRVLKPGGRFFAVDFEPPTNPVIRHLLTAVIGHGMMRSTVRELPAMMEDAGFADAEAGRTRYRQVSFVRGRAGDAPSV